MSLDERVSALIKRIYCAGSDAQEWDHIAVELLTLTGGNAALTSLTDLESGELTTYRAYGRDDTKFGRGIEEYSERYVDDFSLRWGFANPEARFCRSEQTLGNEDYLRNDYVRWNHDRFGSTHWCVGYTPPTDELSFTFSLHFPASQGRGSVHSQRLFRMLFDHMECAVRLQRRPFNADSTHALVVVGTSGVVRQLTVPAEHLLASPGALRIRDGFLEAEVHSEQAKIDAALSGVLTTLQSGASHAAVKIINPHGGRPWLLKIRPLIHSYGPFGRIRIELLIEILHSSPRIGSLELMQSLFDLTPRETQVVRLLAEGHSVESLSHKMGISLNTARTHLRSIFAKTSTGRQSELLLLCATLTHD